MLLRLTARLWGSHIHLRYSTSATCFRFPQLLYDRTQAPTQLVIHNFCYRIDIHVDTRGVASPVSEQSSGFLDDPPGYTASLRRLLTKIYFLGTEGGRTLPPSFDRSSHHACCHARFARFPSCATRYSVYDACQQRFTRSVPRAAEFYPFVRPNTSPTGTRYARFARFLFAIHNIPYAQYLLKKVQVRCLSCSPPTEVIGSTDGN